MKTLLLSLALLGSSAQAASPCTYKFDGILKRSMIVTDSGGRAISCPFKETVHLGKGKRLRDRYAYMYECPNGLWASLFVKTGQGGHYGYPGATGHCTKLEHRR